MSVAGIPLGQREAERDRVAVEAEQTCPACHKALWLSFYFDGFGYSDKSGSKTNIVKIFQAAYERPHKGIRAFYYPGLGADFDPETAALARAIGDRVVSDVEDSAKNAGKDVAKAAGAKTVKEAQERIWDPVTKAWRQKRAKGGSLLESAQAATGGAKTAIRRQTEEVRKTVQRVSRSPRKYADRQIKRLRKEWRGLWRAVQRHPWRAWKTAGVVVAKNTVGAGGESIGLLRDSVLLAGLFNTGVDTRLSAAEKDFKAAVGQARRMGQIEHINVALFGYDMGGGLTLAFCKKLLTEICSDGRYEEVPVKIRFMGLFDCVVNRYDDNFLTGYMPLSNAVSSELYLPEAVERCVHYAAAHELRFYKPLSIIGANPEDFRGRRQEQMFPGAQEDVGGGAEPDEDGVSDQLARYPLQRMYNRAYGAGVPMPSLVKLENERPDLYLEIKISADAESFQDNYRKAVKSLVSVTRVLDPSILQLQNPATLAKGQAELLKCTIPPPPQQITELPEDVDAQYKGHIAIYIQWLRMWYDQNAERAQERNGLFGAAVDARAYSRYQFLADELKYLENNAKAGPQFSMQQAKSQIDGKVAPNMFVTDPQAQALYWIWRNPGKRLPDVEALYPGFLAHVHDSMAESALEGAYGDLIAAKHYFNRRPMHKLSTKPDPGFLEKLNMVYRQLFGK